VALETYRAMRDFAASPEPKGRKARKRGDSFVVQKHAARRLHYDLRLELDGVLKSWAVTRGPSLVAGEKRLAVEVEDHPLDYGGFEGEIPEGSYGAGRVIVWDRGRWAPVGDPAKGLAKGHLEFTLEGEKLGGRWHLARMARKPREKRDNWLLIKADDEFARPPDAPDILVERPDSVLSGAEIGPRPPAAARRARGPRKAAAADPFPGFVPPQLATLRPSAPTGAAWVHEIKFDGYRVEPQIRDGAARLLTRTGLDWTERFGAAIPAALAALPAEAAVLDGEIVVETARGVSDFAALQADLAAGRGDRLVLYLFDLLHCDGRDLRPEPLLARKAALAELLAGAGPPLRLSEHFDADGDVMLRHACRLSLEGVVSKRRDAPYRSGRGRDWIKSKCAERQEFVVAGFTPSKAAADAVGALVLGYWRDGALVHAGRVGSGFDRREAAALHARLAPTVVRASPFAAPLSAEARRDVRFVRPELVAEVEFRGWSGGDLLRHASFRGLREDKPAAEVAREDAASADAGDDAAGRAAAAPRARRRASAAARARPAGADRPAPPGRLTSPDRVYWPETGATKADLAAWYAAVWPRMAPHVAQRPLALLRCPEGRTKACFFQKHVWRGQSPDILVLPDPAGDPGETLLGVGDLAGLVGLVQGGALEIHGWQARFDALETPDQIVMDLDPGEGVDWPALVAAAAETRARLERAGLGAFVKSSGGKGLHVVAPLAPQAGWEAVKGFAKGIAEAMAAEAPDRFVATIAKAKRRGRILVDYLRNGRGATAVVPYSSRAREGAPVAMPLAWDELRPEAEPVAATLADGLDRLDADPWAEFDAARRPLPEAAQAPRRRRT
jgi:bifunctional non-homologous end joining protein LigD